MKYTMSTINELNNYIHQYNISDFMIKEMRGETLYLVGSFDLAYYYDIEIIVTGVSCLNLSCYFYVDLSKIQPFSVNILSDTGTKIFSFEDESTQQKSEICFTGNISFCVEHISYYIE